MKSSKVEWQRGGRAAAGLIGLLGAVLVARTVGAQTATAEAAIAQAADAQTATAHAATAQAATAQGPITDPPVLALATAQQRARANGYAARAARGVVTTSEGRTTASLQGVLPSMRVEVGYARTNDPLGAFGSTLRQRDVSAASFSPSALNYPEAVGNASSALVMELPLINADAWRGRKAAQRAVEAAEASRDWATDEATLQVTQAYFAAVYANERANAFDTALAAAASQVRQTASQLRNGVVTRSDALLAEVQTSRVQSASVAARAEAQIARARLAMAMGMPEEMNWSLPASLPDTKRIHDLAASARGTSERKAADSTLGSAAVARSDVQAARLAADAARLSESGARAAYLPRVNAVVRMDRNTPSNVIGGRGSWTLGVMMSWSPFANPALIGAAQSERGRAASSQAQADAASTRAQLDMLQTGSALTVALAQLDIVEQALQQGVEAHRIVSRKYDGGIATITDLLGAAAVETETRIGVVDARYRALSAIAEQMHARGATLAPLTAIDTY